MASTDIGWRIRGLRDTETVDRSPLHYSRLWYTLGWLMVAAVILLSISPEVPNLPDVPASDKVEHVAAYMTLMCWFCQLHREPRRRFWVGAGLFALGVGLELVQALLVFRTAELADALADGCGILVGWCAVKTRVGNLLPYLDGRLLRLMKRS
jgi:VanZ family protein